MNKKKWKKPKIVSNKLTKWHWKVSHSEHFKMGENVDIGSFTYIQSEFGVYIGDNVQIGAHCSIYSKNSINNTHGPVIIQEGAMIGAHSVILPGVIIRKNKLIKAGSVISK